MARTKLMRMKSINVIRIRYFLGKISNVVIVSKTIVVFRDFLFDYAHYVELDADVSVLLQSYHPQGE